MYICCWLSINLKKSSHCVALRRKKTSFIGNLLQAAFEADGPVILLIAIPQISIPTVQTTSGYVKPCPQIKNTLVR